MVCLELEMQLQLQRRKCLLSVGRTFLYAEDHHRSPFGHERLFNVVLDRLHQQEGLTNSPQS
jgi:hypothetical protein